MLRTNPARESDVLDFDDAVRDELSSDDNVHLESELEEEDLLGAIAQAKRAKSLLAANTTRVRQKQAAHRASAAARRAEEEQALGITQEAEEIERKANRSREEVSADAQRRWRKLRAAVKAANAFGKGGLEALISRNVKEASETDDERKYAAAVAASLLAKRARSKADLVIASSKDTPHYVAARHGWVPTAVSPRGISAKRSMIHDLEATLESKRIDEADKPVFTEEETSLHQQLRDLSAARKASGLPKLKPQDADSVAEQLGVDPERVRALLQRQRRPSIQPVEQALPKRFRNVKFRVAARVALNIAKQKQESPTTPASSDEALFPDSTTESPLTTEAPQTPEKREYVWHTVMGVISELALSLKTNVTEATWFSTIVLGAIFLAALSTIIGAYSRQLNESGNGNVVLVFTIIDEVVLWLFVIEAILKFLAEMPRFWKYFLDMSNILDFVIVVFSFPQTIPDADTGMVRVLRLLRILRLVRVLPGLRRLVKSLANALSTLAYVGGFLLLMLYTWAVAGAILLGPNDPAHWNGVHISAITLYARSLLMDDWADVMDTALYGCDSPKSVYTGGIGGTSRDGFPAVCTTPIESPVSGTILFLSWELLGTFVGLNLVVGSIVQSVAELDQAGPGSGSAAVIEVLKCDDLEAADLLGTSDPYVTVSACHPDGTVSTQFDATAGTGVSQTRKKSRTKIKFRTLNPRWANERFLFQPLEETGPIVRLCVFDFDRIGTDDPLGEAQIDMRLVPENQPLELTLPLLEASTGTITVRVERKLASGELALDELSPEDRLISLTKMAEAKWDAIRWELSAAAANRKRLRAKALKLHVQSLKRLSGLVSALALAKQHVASSHVSVPEGNSARDAKVSVDREIRGWVRARAESDKSVRWFHVEPPKAPGSPSRLVGDRRWLEGVSSGHE
jgi:voltage-gated sodium channel